MTKNIIPPMGEEPTGRERKLLSKYFPNLKDKEWKKTANPTGHPGFPPYDPNTYNCFAWSLCRDDIGWIWSHIDHFCNNNGIVEIDDFDCFYDTFHLHVCGNTGKNCNPEYQTRKVALFCLNGMPTHAAKEIADGGWWESKIGGEIRIIHKIEQLEGGQYGDICRCYCKEDITANLHLKE